MGKTKTHVIDHLLSVIECQAETIGRLLALLLERQRENDHARLDPGHAGGAAQPAPAAGITSVLQFPAGGDPDGPDRAVRAGLGGLDLPPDGEMRDRGAAGSDIDRGGVVYRDLVPGGSQPDGHAGLFRADDPGTCLRLCGGAGPTGDIGAGDRRGNSVSPGGNGAGDDQRGVDDGDVEPRFDCQRFAGCTLREKARIGPSASCYCKDYEPTAPAALVEAAAPEVPAGQREYNQCRFAAGCAEYQQHGAAACHGCQYCAVDEDPEPAPVVVTAAAPTRHCRVCDQDQPATAFRNRWNICDDCRQPAADSPPTRVCTDCHQEQPLEEFGKKAGRDNPGGRRPFCRSCGKKRRGDARSRQAAAKRAAREAAADAPVVVPAPAAPIPPTAVVVPHKVCTRCDQDKPLNEFGPYERTLDKRDFLCGDCRSLATSEREQRATAKSRGGATRAAIRAAGRRG